MEIFWVNVQDHYELRLYELHSYEHSEL